MSTESSISHEDNTNTEDEVNRSMRLTKKECVFVGRASVVFAITLVVLYIYFNPDIDLSWLGPLIYSFYGLIEHNCDKIVDAKYRIKNNDLSCDFNECKPWPKDYILWFNRKKKSPPCKPVNKNLYYYIKDDMIFVRDEVKSKINCNYTCYSKRNYEKLDIAKNVTINGKAILECDVPWVKCYNEENEKVYENIELVLKKLNATFEERRDFLKPGYSLPNDVKKYSFHVIVIDSLSYYNALRALNKTRSVLLKHGGIEMKYLNIQGENSMPNAYGFLLNKFKDNVEDNSFGRPTKINDWGLEDPCYVPLDNTTFIFDYYKKMGYLTLYADDFFLETFEWPDCVGFTTEYTHHSTRVRQLFNSNDTKKIIRGDFKNKCYLFGQDLFKYHEDFLQRYSNQPTASLTWQTNLVHSDIDNIFEQDEYLSEYFERNSKYYKDSFLIIMADHGFRLGRFMNTEIGRYEYLNPYLLIKPPADLLENEELIGNLKANSIKHISHLDLYATFLDILTEGPKNNFTNLKPYDLSNVVNDKIKGLSLLRPLPDENRSCYDMNIPSRYCLCQPKYTKLVRRQSTEIFRKLEEVFIKDINKQLEHDNLKEICSQLTLQNDVKDYFVVQSSEGKNTMLYEVNAITKPGQGSFRAYYNQNFTLLDDIIRTNMYKGQADVCGKPSKYTKFCYCKILLKN
uniref:Sulfatase domain-containing protein n=1 Tax=Strongyloides papillosus TaxID=174720 RepID=A0A0N5C068_STREA